MILKLPMKNRVVGSAGRCFRPQFSHEDLCMIMQFVKNKDEEMKICENNLRNSIINVIFNPPATIVFWNDGVKTVVKAVNEPFDPEKGLAMAICKRFFGNDSKYYSIFRKWIPQELMEEAEMERSRWNFEPCEPKSEQNAQKEPNGEVEEFYKYRKLMQDGYLAQKEDENGA